MSTTSRRLGWLAACLTSLFALLPVATASAAEPDVDLTVRCNIPATGWAHCSSDGATVAPTRKVYVALRTSGGKSVAFRVYNADGWHLLSEGPYQPPGSGFYFQWYNNTGRNIRVELMANAASSVSVSAVATERIRS